MNEKKEILKAIKGLTATQSRMALILLRINGKDNALEFIKKMKEKAMNCECLNWVREPSPVLTKHHPRCPHYNPNIIKIWTVTPDRGCAPCTERDLSAIAGWIENAETGAVIQIVVGEIDEAIYNEMPEYLGP